MGAIRIILGSALALAWACSEVPARAGLCDRLQTRVDAELCLQELDERIAITLENGALQNASPWLRGEREEIVRCFSDIARVAHDLVEALEHLAPETSLLRAEALRVLSFSSRTGLGDRSEWESIGRQALAEAAPFLPELDPRRVRAIHFASGAIVNLHDAAALQAEALRIQNLLAPWDARRMTPLLEAYAISVWHTEGGLRASPIFEARLATLRARSPEESPRVLLARLALARCYWHAARRSEAREILDEVVATLERTEPRDIELRAVSMNLAGILAMEDGEFGAAESLLLRSRAMRARIHGEDHEITGQSDFNLGTLYRTIGDYPRAELALRRAQAVWDARLPKNDPESALPHLALAGLFIEAGRPESARPYLERSMELLRNLPSHMYWPIAKRTEASLLLATAHPVQALDAANAALPVFVERFGKLHPWTGELLDVRGEALLRIGAPDEALAAAESAVESRVEGLGAVHPDTASAWTRLARARARAGDPSGAVDAATRGIESWSDHFRRTVAALPEHQALRHAEKLQSSLGVALTLLAHAPDPEHVERVWGAVLRTRGIVLDATAQRMARESRPDSVTSPLRSQLERVQARLSNLVLAPPEAGTPEAIAAAMAEQDRIEREMLGSTEDSSNPGFASLAAIRARLGPGEYLVAYVRHPGLPDTPRDDDRYVAFVTGREGPTGLVSLREAATLDDAIEAWRVLASTRPSPLREEADRQARTLDGEGRRIRRMLWDPVQRATRNATGLFVIPDGAIHLLPIAALPSSAGGYLIEENLRLRVLSTERDLLADAPARASAGSLLVMGGPDFARAERTVPGPLIASATRRAVTCEEVLARRFEDLPAAREEAGRVAARWRHGAADREGSGTVTLLSGARATESAFKALAPGVQNLHVATHGFFLSSGCGLAGSMTRDNPLLRSALVFAGVRDESAAAGEQDDGLMTAAEVAALPLGGVDTAVLSACETGVGDLAAAEGVFGLRRALRVAGVRSVVTSLWSVDDSDTSAWMDAFYARRVAGADAPESADGASRERLRALRASGKPPHPFHWAAFVAEGR